MLLSISLESCAGPNVMMQQVTQRMDDAGQDPCGAHHWAPEAAKLLTVVARGEATFTYHGALAPG